MAEADRVTLRALLLGFGRTNIGVRLQWEYLNANRWEVVGVFHAAFRGWDVLDCEEEEQISGICRTLCDAKAANSYSSVELPLAGVEVDGVVLRLVTDESREESEA